jgi:hypothetical protein
LGVIKKPAKKANRGKGVVKTGNTSNLSAGTCISPQLSKVKLFYVGLFESPLFAALIGAAFAVKIFYVVILIEKPQRT